MSLRMLTAKSINNRVMRRMIRILYFALLAVAPWASGAEKLYFTYQFNNEETQAIEVEFFDTLPDGIIWDTSYTPVLTGKDVLSDVVYSDFDSEVRIAKLSLPPGNSTLTLCTLGITRTGLIDNDATMKPLNQEPIIANAAITLDGMFVGYTDGAFSNPTGAGSPKVKIRSNNGHGNNYDGVDGSNPALVKGLVTMADSGSTDDEIDKNVPKNSSFFNNGAPLTSSLSEGLLFIGNSFNVYSPGTPFTIGYLQWHNGSTDDTTKSDAVVLSVGIQFTKPNNKKADFTFNLKLVGKDQAKSTNYIEITDPAGKGGDWPIVMLDLVSYQLVPEFGGLTSGNNGGGGKLRFQVDEGASGAAELLMTLVPVP
jgi:hypothetical protein